MDNIIPIDKNFVTVADVISDLIEEQDDIKEIYVVVIDKDRGAHKLWASGTVQGMAYASLVMSRRVHITIEDGLV